MNRSYTSKASDYASASAYLGDKTERPLPHSKNLRIRRLFSMIPERHALPEIVVTLHGNVIARFEEGKAPDWTCESMYRNSLTSKRHRYAMGGPWKV